jgi:glycosyltransferase involved in cell wall biosynthesis
MKSKLLWVGDANVSTGFAKSTHHILAILSKTWNVTVLGINYDGDPHDHPYPIYPAFPGGDVFGLGRVAEVINHHRPDIVVVQNDPWNIPEYLKRVGNIPMVGVIAVDGKNCRGRGLNGLACAVFWTKFGETEARLGGYSGPSAVIPLGVDLEIYRPGDRQAARAKLGLPADRRTGFLVGNVNRNQQRKRLDLCVSYFAEWMRTYKINDAHFLFHAAPTGDNGYDVKQLAQYFGVANHLIFAEPEIGHGVDEDTLATVYQALDVGLTCTQGEGFGLTTLEGMACGIPQIVPNWSALGEWCEDAAIQIPCSEIACTPNKINAVGGVMDRVPTIEALNALYESKHGQVWARYQQRGLELARRDCFRWDNIGEEMNRVLADTLHHKTVLRMPALAPVTMEGFGGPRRAQ